MKNWRTVSILGLVLITLGGIASWDEWQTKKDKESEQLKNRLTSIKVEEVDEIEYQSEPNLSKSPSQTAENESMEEVPSEKLQLKGIKKDGHWSITSPIVYAADNPTIESLLKTITEYAYSQEIPAGKEKWPDYGLEHPQRTITIRRSTPTPQDLTLFIGNKSPVGYNVYFRLSSSDKVFLGSQHLLVATTKSLFDFRDKKIVSIDEPNIQFLRYENTGQAPTELAKTSDGYRMKFPHDAEGDSAEVRDFISELNSLRALGFEDHPSQNLIDAFSKPDLVINWQDKSGSQKTLNFTTIKGKIFASGNPSVIAFTISEDARQKIRKDALSFRNRRILSNDLLDVKTIEIDGNSYENLNGTWYQPKDAQKLPETKAEQKKDSLKEQAHIRALMVDLEFAKTDKFYQPNSPEVQKYLENPPLHRLKINYATSGKTALTIDLFFADEKEKFFVRRSDQSTIYRIPRAAFHSMEPGPPESIDKEKSSAPPDELPVDDSEDTSLNLSSPSADTSG